MTGPLVISQTAQVSLAEDPGIELPERIVQYGGEAYPQKIGNEQCTGKRTRQKEMSVAMIKAHSSRISSPDAIAGRSEENDRLVATSPRGRTARRGFMVLQIMQSMLYGIRKMKSSLQTSKSGVPDALPISIHILL